MQRALDVASLAPGLGTVASLANAGISLARGDRKGAVLNALGAIPGGAILKTAVVAGTAVVAVVKVTRTVAKIVDKGSDAGKDVTTSCRAIQKSRNTIYSWIEKEWIRTVPLADGWRLIVYSSLFDKPLLKFDRLTGEPVNNTATTADARKNVAGLRLASGGR